MNKRYIPVELIETRLIEIVFLIGEHDSDSDFDKGARTALRGEFVALNHILSQASSFTNK